MPLFIDGNNLLHAPMPPSLAGLDEPWLCRVLARSPWRGQRIVVVLDGAPAPLREIQSPEPDVELIWSGPKRTADDVIVELVQRDTAPRRVLVVSSDHGLQRQVKRRGASVMDAQAFVPLLAQWQAQPGATDATSRPQQLDAGEVERWLREFGLDDET